MSSTAQQIHTLLSHLRAKTPPPFEVLFWSNLQKIDFDDSPHSIVRLGDFFDALAKRQYTLDKLLNVAGGAALVVAVAAYIANYVAIVTGEAVEWLDFAEWQRQPLPTSDALSTQQPASFGYSLTARIGKHTDYQPLTLIPSLLKGDGDLPASVATTVHTVFARAEVNLLQDANAVCQQYLAKLKTGRLLDHTFAFYPYLAGIVFDYSLESLAAIDAALLRIQQDLLLNRQDYVGFVNDKAKQRVCYLLGFYIGIASSRQANTAVKWVNAAQMQQSLGTGFTDCIEQHFVLLQKDGYHTPMLVITNRLFALAPNFPAKAVDFANILQQQSAGQIRVYPYLPVAPTLPTVASTAKYWQQALQDAGVLLARQIIQLASGQPVLPCRYEAPLGLLDAPPAIDTQVILDKQAMVAQAQKSAVVTATLPMNMAYVQYFDGVATDTALTQLYQSLQQNPRAVPYSLACYDSWVNLPIGRTQGLVLEVRVYEAASLQLQLILPYQTAQNHSENLPSLILYPIVNNQSLATVASPALRLDEINHWVQFLYQACLGSAPIPDALSIEKIWQDHFVNVLDLWALPSKQRHVPQAATKFELTLLPVLADTVPVYAPVPERIDHKDDHDKLRQNANLTPLSPTSDSLTAAPVALMAAGIKPDMTALKAQLLSEKARLQSQLSTQDRIKEKKLLWVGAFILLLLVFVTLFVKTSQ